MSWIIGDSFDFYATITDAGVNFWDTASGFALTAGRFTGSQSITQFATATVGLAKSSGSNDVTHHLVCAFIQTTALSGTTIQLYFQLLDTTTGQVCVCFRSDGAIVLTSGTPAGTVLATYTGAFSANVWNGFEFEITINGTTGAFHVRRNGNAADDFVATGLNTKPGTNAYANKLQIGWASSAGTPAQRFDDVLWFNTTGSAPNTWVGDIRATQQMPASVVSQQFAPSPNPVAATVSAGSGSTPRAAGVGSMTAFTATFSGTVASATVSVNSGGTGNLKAAIYDATRSVVLATSNAVVNPVAGVNVLTFASPASVVKGTQYWLAVDQDVSLTYNNSQINSGFTFTTAYASFPAAAPTTTGGTGPLITATITPSNNIEFVSEAQEDGLTTYVFDATVGHADLYNVAPLSFTPAAIIAVQTRGFIEKSDAGARSASLQIKSGSTTVNSPTLALATSFQNLTRIDVVDPNTGSTWSTTAVNNLQIGPVVAA